VYRRTSEMAREEETMGHHKVICDFLQTHEQGITKSSVTSSKPMSKRRPWTSRNGYFQLFICPLAKSNAI